MGNLFIPSCEWVIAWVKYNNMITNVLRKELIVLIDVTKWNIGL